jgi:CRISPR-associated protein Csm3
MSQILKLEKKVFIRAEIELLTGMHVGGSSIGLAIGGADKVVVRNPLTNLPYLPGSSIKGKMRSLLEKANDLVKPEKDNNGKWKASICTDLNQPLVQLFGAPAESSGNAEIWHAPTRLSVRDGSLLNEVELANAEATDMYCTEVKTEVNIDRLTSMANPRNFERVPAGARFGLEMVVDIYNVDMGDMELTGQYFELLAMGLRLLQDDYLGGQGSRGYGQVRFENLRVEEKTADDYRNGGTVRPSDYQSYFKDLVTVGAVAGG